MIDWLIDWFGDWLLTGGWLIDCECDGNECRTEKLHGDCESVWKKDPAVFTYEFRSCDHFFNLIWTDIRTVGETKVQENPWAVEVFRTARLPVVISQLPVAADFCLPDGLLPFHFQDYKGKEKFTNKWKFTERKIRNFKSINQSIDQSINQSINQSIEQSINRGPISSMISHQSIDQPNDETLQLTFFLLVFEVHHPSPQHTRHSRCDRRWFPW